MKRAIGLAIAIALWADIARGQLGPIRPEFEVSTGPTYSYYSYNLPHPEAENSVDVAASRAGTFIVAWDDFYQYVGDEPRPGIFSRRLDGLGRPLDREFRASPLASYPKGSSHVASDDDGNFVVVWDERSDYGLAGLSDTDGLRIMAQRFNTNGGRLGSAFQVNTYTTDDQYTPKVAFDGAGNFVVVWAYYRDNFDTAVLAGQKYSASGTPMGGEFQVNSDTSCCIGYTGFEQRAVYDDVDVAGDAAGNFVVVWRGPTSDGFLFDGSITARFFDSAGAPQSDQFAISAITTIGQVMPAVKADGQGRFIVAWSQGYGNYGSRNVFARRYYASGTPVGADFQVNSGGEFEFTDGPSIAADATGRFVVVWRERDSEYFNDSVRGREFDSAGIPVASQFRIDVPPDGYYYDTMKRAKVAASAAGDFVVVWSQSDDAPYSDYYSHVVGRRLGEQAAPCNPAPATGCRETTNPGSGVLTFKNSPNPNSSRLSWRFSKGPAQSAADFGDPFTADGYSVCLYDGSANPQPLYAAPVPANGACGAVPCWREVGRAGGIDYYDAKQQFVEGITQIRLSAGPEGRARGFVKGRGPKLSLPDTPLTAPVTFQLQSSHGECWSGTYASQIVRNANGAFKAKPD